MACQSGRPNPRGSLARSGRRVADRHGRVARATHFSNMRPVVASLYPGERRAEFELILNMAALAALLLLAGFTVIVLQYWERLMGDDDSAHSQRWIWRWYLKGLVVPVVIWVFLVAGGLPGVPSLFGKLGPNPVASAINASAAGLIVISSYWAAMTLAWLLAAIAVRLPEDNWR